MCRVFNLEVKENKWELEALLKRNYSGIQKPHSPIMVNAAFGYLSSYSIFS